MSGLLVMEKLPGKWTARLLEYLMPASLLLRYLMSSVGGTLILALLIYATVPILWGVQPWTPEKLLLWVDELPIEAKTGVFTSLLTVVGFLVAFHSATEAWKGQALGEIKLKIAAELEGFSNEAARLITDLEIHAKDSLRAVKSYRANGVTQETVHLTEWAIERSENFKVARQRLSTMGVEVNRIVGNNFSVLASLPGAANWMDQYVAALDLITEKMWIQIPLIPDGSSRYAYFSDKVNVTAYENLIACCEEKASVMVGLIGGIKGALLQAVVSVNLHTYLALRKHKSKLPQVFQNIRNATKPDKKPDRV